MRRNWTNGLCLTLFLSLILLGGFALESSAQTPAPPANPSAPATTPAPSEPAKPAPEATPTAPQSQMQKDHSCERIWRALRRAFTHCCRPF